MSADRPLRMWDLPPADEASVCVLARDGGLSRLLARLLVARGIADVGEARRFLTPDLTRDWRDPFALPGMAGCAEAVAAAVRSGDDILVFGDFDADGITAAAVLHRGLASMGARVRSTVPHRFREGYGLSGASVERIIGLAPALVVTVDCGISSATEVETLAAAGVRVVVTDHHEPGEGVPDGVPVCDPKLGACGFDGLAGAGVALKLVAAVGSLLGHPDAWRDLTDLAAVGTVGDIVPLLDENRALVADGLARMASAPCPGLAALATAAAVEPESLDSERVAFALVPRINAAGRMHEPEDALRLLLTDDRDEAARLAGSLDGHNRERQVVEQGLAALALEQARDLWSPDRRVLVLSGEGWHEGVRGIVASRVTGAFGVPTLVFSIENDEARGSGRSVPGIDLYQAVGSASAMLTRFGGHEAAVGVTLPAARLPELERVLAERFAELDEEAFRPRLAVDAEIELGDIGLETAEELAALEPHGAGNPRPVLVARSVFLGDRRRVGSDASHLRFDAFDGVGTLPAIWFRCPDIEAMAAHDGAVDLAFHLAADEWRGRARVQARVRDGLRHEQAADAPAAELVADLFADAERILAGGAYAGIGDAESFHTKLAGVTFEGRQEVVAALAPGEALRLERQPDNEHDANACAVFDPVGRQVGFLNRGLAEALAPLIDGGRAYQVQVTEVTGGTDGKGLGVNVLVSREAGPGDGEEAELAAARRAELAAMSADALDDALRAELIGERPLHAAQVEALARLSQGTSTLAVMATGRGKSLIFQLHAAREAIAGRGASVFVYPLRALVSDQSFHVGEVFARLGLRCEVLTGETAPGGRDDAFAALAGGSIDVVMTTPEFLERNVERFASAGRVRFAVIDEAHHIALARSGHRPAYARIGETLSRLDAPTVLAVTATAGDEVADAIVAAVGVEAVVLDPTVRDNLRLADRRGVKEKDAHVSALAGRGDKVIVYVNSREQSVRLAQRIHDSGPRLRDRCAFYNGGMNRASRHAVERAFREGDLTAVVATSAFGEGVNIPDVRHVVLYHLPFHAVEFNQMCGRAGRDGKPATVHLLFGQRDAAVNDLILEASAPDLDDLRALYAALRDRVAAAGGEPVEVTNADLAADVKARRPKARLSEKGVSAGVGVFREMGLVGGKGAGGYRRLWLEPVPAERVDLTASVRYAEGLREADEFAGFRAWVLSASADELLSTFDRPLLPRAR